MWKSSVRDNWGRRGSTSERIKEYVQSGNSEGWRKGRPIFKNSGEGGKSCRGIRTGKRGAGQQPCQEAGPMPSFKTANGQQYWMLQRAQDEKFKRVHRRIDCNWYERSLGRWRCSTIALRWQWHTSVSSLKLAEHLKLTRNGWISWWETFTLRLLII